MIPPHIMECWWERYSPSLPCHYSKLLMLIGRAITGSFVSLCVYFSNKRLTNHETKKTFLLIKLLNSLTSYGLETVNFPGDLNITATNNSNKNPIYALALKIMSNLTGFFEGTYLGRNTANNAEKAGFEILSHKNIYLDIVKVLIAKPANHPQVLLYKIQIRNWNK